MLIASLFTNLLFYFYIEFLKEKDKEREIEVYEFFLEKFKVFSNNFYLAVHDVDDRIAYLRARDHAGELKRFTKIFPDETRIKDLDESMRILIKQIERVEERYLADELTKLEAHRLDALAQIAVNYFQLSESLQKQWSYKYQVENQSVQWIEEIEQELAREINYYISENEGFMKMRE